MPIIGAHVSTAGGLKNAVKNAQKIGAQCLQIFGASPRAWQAKQHDEQDVKEYKAALKAAALGPVFLHAAYLVNLGSKPENYKKSVTSLTDHLRIADAIGAQGLIFHIGSATGHPYETALAQVVKGMKEVLKNVPGDTQLIMENSAGGGNKIGTSAREIGGLFKSVDSKRVKVCIDTAHAFECGEIMEYTKDNVKTFLDKYDEYVGMDNIVCFHINDSKTAAGSFHDRHENIGEGEIGLDGFKNLAKDKRMKDMPWIMEVPGFNGAGPDEKNVEILRKIT